MSPSPRTPQPAGPGPADDMRTGVMLALAAYGMWGVLPAYYKLTDTIPADIVVAHRILWSVIFVGGYLVLLRRGAEIREALTDPAIVLRLSVSAVLIGVNWLVFVWAIENQKVLDVSLGYFINPLVSILIGLVLLRERLTRFQGIAVAMAAVAVALQAAVAGGLPWVSLVLAFSFAGYGYMRKVTPVRPTPGMVVETVLLLPVALGFLLLNVSWGVDAFMVNDIVLLAALAGTGIVTALPLICFSGAARRLPLVLIGVMQYLAPSLHFAMAVFIWGEPLDPAKLSTFAIIWAALAIFTADSWRQYARTRRETAAGARSVEGNRAL